MDDAQGFEAALGVVESESEGALKAAASVARELKKAKAAAASGQARDLRRALEAAEGLATQLAETVRTLRGDYDFDETAHLASGAYAKELLVAAEAAGLAVADAGRRRRRPGDRQRSSSGRRRRDAGACRCWLACSRAAAWRAPCRAGRRRNTWS